MRLSGVFTVVAGMALGSTALAQEVETVVITEQRVSGPERIAPTTFATVIDAPQYAAELETVSDALSESVGVQVRRFGGLGAFATVSIRGSSPNQVQIYLDGIPISPARNETVNLSDLPIDGIERIEVYRGTIPIGFGVVGSGGVVNLVTKPPTSVPVTEVSAAYGSFETRKVVASHRREVHGVGLMAHVAYLGSKGDFTYKDDQTLDNSNDPNPKEFTRKNNEFDSVDAIFKAAYSLNDRTHVDLTNELFYKDQGVPGIGRFTSRKSSFEELRSLNYLRVFRQGFLVETLDLTTSLFGTYLNERFVDKEGRTGRLRQDRDDDTVNVGSNALFNLAVSPSQTLSVFTELSHEEFSPRNNRQDKPDGPQQRRLRWTGGLQDELWIVPDRLLFVPTIQYEHLNDDVTASFTPAGMPLGREKGARNLWSGVLGLQLTVVEWFVLKGNLGRLQRAPNFSELFGNSANLRGNPDLKPETAINRDIGFRASADDLPWESQAFVEYAYFNNDIDDLITFIQTGPTVARPFNIGAARIRGHEVVGSLDTLRHLGIDVNYTHQDAEDRGDDATYRGQQLPFRPKDEAYARVELYDQVGSIYYEYNFIGSNLTARADIGRNRVGSRSLHAAGIAFNATDWLTLRFEARNLSDSEIRDVADFPLPGRSFFGSASTTF